MPVHGATAIGEVSGEPCEHMGEPGLRIDIVELEGLDQGKDCGTLASLIGARVDARMNWRATNDEDENYAYAIAL